MPPIGTGGPICILEDGLLQTNSIVIQIKLAITHSNKDVL